MFRWFFVFLFFVSIPVSQVLAQGPAEAIGASPAPAAAKQRFEQLHQQWSESISTWPNSISAKHKRSACSARPA